MAVGTPWPMPMCELYHALHAQPLNSMNYKDHHVIIIIGTGMIFTLSPQPSRSPPSSPQGLTNYFTHAWLRSLRTRYESDRPLLPTPAVLCIRKRASADKPEREAESDSRARGMRERRELRSMFGYALARSPLTAILYPIVQAVKSENIRV